MSRNGHFRMHGSLATAYSPDAERSAEGDILGVSAYDLRGLREDDANMRMGVSAYDLRGLREDDANLRMGNTEFDGATSSAEGSAEGHAVKQLGGILVSNGRVGGMNEDHWDVRMGVSAYDRMGVSAYDLRGLREDDASVRMGVSAYDLRGLREDDASVRMGTAYVEDASGSAEDPRGRAGMGVSAYDLGRRANRLTPGYGTEYAGEYRGKHYGGQYRRSGYMRGLREDDANLRMGDVDDMGAEAWAIEQKGRPFTDKVEQLRMGTILRGLREDDASVRMGVSAYDLRGLREDDASVRMGVSAYDMGRRRAFTYRVSGAEQYPPQMLNATGFHERFPVSFQIRGLGLVRIGSTWSEAMPRIQTAIAQEAALMARISRLNDTAKAAILAQTATLNKQGYSQLFNGQLQAYLNGGEGNWTLHEGSERRLADTEKMIPTVDSMVTAYERGASPNQAVNAAISDVNAKLNALSAEGIMKYALPIGAGVVVAGGLTALVVSLAK
jgi:hypothetical protein